MTFDELIQAMNPEIYKAVKEAVEIGKWPNGEVLDLEQKQTCMQAMIAYEDKHLDASERTGFMSGDQLCESEGETISDLLEESPLKWQ